MSSAVRAAVPLVLLLLASVAGRADDGASLRAGVFTPARLAPDFALRGSNGTELRLSRYHGKVVLLAFGYTSCTEVCPITLSILSQAHKKLGAAGADLQVVYVTVDPDRDDVDRMRTFLAIFDPTIVGGTGTAAELAAVRRDYGVVATKLPSPGGYSIAHSSSVYLIDREGKLCALMPFGHDADDFAHDAGILLGNKQPCA